MKVLLGEATLSSSQSASELNTDQKTDIPEPKLDSDFIKEGTQASYAEGYPLEWGKEIWKFTAHGDVLADGVESGSATPDEKYLALATGHSVCIFDLDDYSLACVLKNDIGIVQSVEFAPFPKGGNDGYVLVTDAHDILPARNEQVQLWYLDCSCKERPAISEAEEKKTRRDKFDGSLASFSATAFSHNGKTLLYLRDVHDKYGVHARVTAVNVATGKEDFYMEGHTNPIMWAGFSPDDSLIVTNAWDGYAKVYSTKDGKHLRDLGPTGGQNWACDFSPDGENLAVSRGSRGPSTFIWKPEDPQSFPVALEGTTGWQRHIAWSPDGSRLAIGAADGRLVIYNARSMTIEQLWQLSDQPMKWVREVAGAVWLDGGQRLLFTPMDGSVLLYDFGTNEKWRWGAGEKDEWRSGMWFNTLTVMEKRRLFGSKDQDGSYRIWKLPKI
ncbi:quinon protein alcohol dehydrogenase-like superfamily [Cadophora sp. MPI-SDFR-AT-0126]|nr:quinon protein alcohol dehydrogenase-like superfamily [Leotiomycetes sp. MPI-SDFR-AT-0126]